MHCMTSCSSLVERTGRFTAKKWLFFLVPTEKYNVALLNVYVCISVWFAVSKM